MTPALSIKAARRWRARTLPKAQNCAAVSTGRGVCYFPCDFFPAPSWRHSRAKRRIPVPSWPRPVSGGVTDTRQRGGGIQATNGTAASLDLDRAVFGRDSRRHLADTSAESSARMRDDFEATSSAIWCRAKIRRAMRRSQRDVAREGGGVVIWNHGCTGRPRDASHRCSFAFRCAAACAQAAWACDCRAAVCALVWANRISSRHSCSLLQEAWSPARQL